MMVKVYSTCTYIVKQDLVVAVVIDGLYKRVNNFNPNFFMYLPIINA